MFGRTVQGQKSSPGHLGRCKGTEFTGLQKLKLAGLELHMHKPPYFANLKKSLVPYELILSAE